MNLDVQIQDSGTHLAIAAAGPYTFDNVSNLFDKVRQEVEKRGRYAVVLDMTRIAGHTSNLEIHELARHFTRIWNRAVRIAIVSPEGGVNKFFECVLWTRGITVAVVPDLGTAVDWMSGGVWE